MLKILRFPADFINYVLNCTDDIFWRKPARSDYLYHNKYDICGLKAAQIHEWPFRAAKDHMQPLVALDSFLPYGKKILI